MKENTQEKSLKQVNENGIISKLKNFFRNLFKKNKPIQNAIIVEDSINNSIDEEKNKNTFMQSIKNVENEDTKLLKLQKQYRNGDIKEEEMTEEQVSDLIDLYDKQIASLRKSNELRKQKLLVYRKNIQSGY